MALNPYNIAVVTHLPVLFSLIFHTEGIEDVRAVQSRTHVKFLSRVRIVAAYTFL